jgi:hypothetical protein
VVSPRSVVGAPSLSLEVVHALDLSVNLLFMCGGQRSILFNLLTPNQVSMCGAQCLTLVNVIPATICPTHTISFQYIWGFVCEPQQLNRNKFQISSREYENHKTFK